MELDSILTQIKRADEQRPSFPGEHWLVLGAGIALMARASRSRSLLARLGGQALGAALIGRAATGRDGIPKQIASLLERR